MKDFTIHHVARICHQANKALCESHSDFTQEDWKDAPDWQCESAIKGVKFCLENPDAPASANHESWLKQKTEEGWVYGPTKNAELKTHPCCVPYADLPSHQKSKDHLFKAIVGSLSPFITK